nr:zinc finger, CCHC-type [Tanacetum cinerariifolium]
MYPGKSVVGGSTTGSGCSLSGSILSFSGINFGYTGSGTNSGRGGACSGSSGLVAINSIIESRDAIFDEHMFSSIPRPSQRSLIFKRKLNVNRTIEKFKARLVIQGFKQKSGIDYFDTYALVSYYIDKVLKKFNYSDCNPISTPLDTCKKLMPNRGRAVSQLEYSRVIGCLMYVTTCTRPDIAFAVGKLCRLVYFSYPSVLEGYTDASWIDNTEDNSSTIGRVFLLSAAGKEAEWLKNFLLEIPLWVKPIAPISIHCDSATTLVKAYSQMYNRKSRHLGVRHSMIRELITNGWIPSRVIHQRNYPQRVRSSEAVLVLNYQQALGSNSLLWKVITRFQVISGNHSYGTTTFSAPGTSSTHDMMSLNSNNNGISSIIPFDDGKMGNQDGRLSSVANLDNRNQSNPLVYVGYQQLKLEPHMPDHAQWSAFGVPGASLMHSTIDLTSNNND